MRAFLLVLLLCQPILAETYVFEAFGFHSKILGYLDTNVGRDGLGALYLGGYKWPLTAFDSWWKVGISDDHAHMCLVIHPYAPWIVGILTWQGMDGQLDILSTDWVWWEFQVEVRTEIGDQRSDC